MECLQIYTALIYRASTFLTSEPIFIYIINWSQCVRGSAVYVLTCIHMYILLDIIQESFTNFYDLQAVERTLKDTLPPENVKTKHGTLH